MSQDPGDGKKAVEVTVLLVVVGRFSYGIFGVGMLRSAVKCLSMMLCPDPPEGNRRESAERQIV